MSIYTEKRFLPYPLAQLFELVAAVDRSIEKLRDTPEQTLVAADLVIGFGRIRERYRSRVTLQRPQRIEVTHVDGPFRRLDSHWTFEPVAPSAERPVGGTMLTFHIEFEFRSKLLQSLMAALFEEAAGRMVTAFKGRAKQLYGARRLRVPASSAAAVA
jgi:coenzyme Q-binding protein COQ10